MTDLLIDRIFDLGNALIDQDFLGRLFSLEPIADLLQERFPREAPYSDEECSTFLILAEHDGKSDNDDDRAALLDAMLEIID